MNKINEMVKNGELTALEGKVMEWLFIDGWTEGEYSFSSVWVSDVANGINETTKVTRGIVSSLIQKKYLYMHEVNEGETPFVQATDKGYELDDFFETKWKPQME
ncbi:hypothetical protein [Chengkuizengella marina]|uniref:Uncharacterized protein n=1 Tax=Chengkuizengella marina TaxID=2507566 RepID=A0A6N9Q1D6_9BACL|nr:hypothetical protein [Chengkuizengella marina]NBI28633.1 hypothetical protein [Chengkuizengella marina]